MKGAHLRVGQIVLTCKNMWGMGYEGWSVGDGEMGFGGMGIQYEVWGWDVGDGVWGDGGWSVGCEGRGCWGTSCGGMKCGGKGCGREGEARLA